MIIDPRTSIRDRIRRYLGTETLTEWRTAMAKVIDLLNGLVAQQTAASAAQATSFHNLQSAITRLETAVRDGEASPEIEAAVNDLRNGFATLQKAAEDADNGFEPVDTPTEPVNPGQPAPVDETPTEPVPTDGDTNRR